MHKIALALGVALIGFSLVGCANPDGQGNIDAPPPPSEQELAEMPPQARQAAENARRFAEQERQRTERMGGRQGPGGN